MTDAPDILLVEDNPHDVELTLHAFSQHHPGKHIHVVRDGAEALEFLFYTGTYARRPITGQPRLILLDMKLPLLDGIYVLRQIRSNTETSMIPAVVLTTSREQRDIYQCYRLGINSYIVKPVNFEEFSDVVRILGHYWLLLNQSAIT